MIRWSQAVDQNGNPVFSGIPQSDTINAMVFSDAGVKSDTVPTGANLVYISVAGGSNIFVKIGGTAAVPTADVTDGSASEAGALGRWLKGASAVGVAADGACVVTLAYYS